MRAGDWQTDVRCVCVSAPALAPENPCRPAISFEELVPCFAPVDNTHSGFSAVSLTALQNVPSLVWGHQHERHQSICLERALGRQQGECLCLLTSLSSTLTLCKLWPWTPWGAFRLSLWRHLWESVLSVALPILFPVSSYTVVFIAYRGLLLASNINCSTLH